MPAKDLGTKHTCFKCGTTFYDLKKPEPICPKCGADQRESPALKAPAPERRPRARPEPKPAAEVETVEIEEEADLDEDVDEEPDEDEP